MKADDRGSVRGRIVEAGSIERGKEISDGTGWTDGRPVMMTEPASHEHRKGAPIVFQRQSKILQF